MIQMETTVFLRIQETARQAAVKALAATMRETPRFGTYDDAYLTTCAEARLRVYEQATTSGRSSA